ncbi:zinc finger protein 558-like isoform X2 [Anguilla anguilla]|nr:zinc finger protein 558-like isoform X2 [Anguilla anguilla]XP_035259432.1 zinc finger protein 558-like isoform X2 [Anguilla anguilla]
MMQAGVCLRQDTETTLPELTEQHRIRQKEEELSGLESVYMAESETEYAAPGLNTLEPECVSAHSGVSDVHHTHTSLIKAEPDLVFSHNEDHKTEILKSTELQYVTHLRPDQIKTETDDEGYLNEEHISELQDFKCVMKSDQMKCESSESLESDLVGIVMNGADVDNRDQAERWQCAADSYQNCKKEEICDLLTQYGDLSHHCDIDNENSQTRIVQESCNSGNRPVNCQRTNVIIEPMIINSSKNSSLLNFIQKKTTCKVEIHRGEKLYKCRQCENCFTTKSGLKKHLRLHTGQKVNRCTQCDKCFNTKSNLDTHLRVHTGEKPYKCTQCEKCFRTKYDLNSHLKIHTGEKPYKCTQCEKCFYSKSNLDIHLRIHMGEKPNRCTHCDKRFNKKSHLDIHLRIHTGEKPYKCMECEKWFRTKSDLNTHLRIHTGEKPYNCTQCEKCFNTKSSLNTHLRIHTGEKSYKCTQCEKCFNTKSGLNKHLRIHTGEKPYKCSQCGKCFSIKAHLNSHERIHTVEKRYKCTV